MRMERKKDNNKPGILNDRRMPGLTDTIYHAACKKRRAPVQKDWMKCAYCQQLS